jgi:hypothetical protein
MSKGFQFMHAAELEKELDAIGSTAEFCRQWASKWRALAVAAQSALAIFFPAAAKVVGILITIADTTCKVGGE